MDPEVIRKARWVGRILLVIGSFTILSAIFLFVTAPHGPSPMLEPAEHEFFGVTASAALPGGALATALFGLAWMWRIHRAPMRTDAPMWRYRDADSR